jgi:FAD/FMN-containing dehydrogenase
VIDSNLPYCLEFSHSLTVENSTFFHFEISIQVETETAWVERGATLGETYSAIADSSKNHGFSAGSCLTVGVGGHIGGGGFGLLSRKYGLAADNVVDALLIDANGRLLD